MTGPAASPRVASDEGAAPLPQPRGPLSAAVLGALRLRPGVACRWPPVPVDDPFGEDVQLTLHLCYELHYRGLRGVDSAWEWDPGLLRLRGQLEQLFLEGLRAHSAGGDDAAAELDALLVEPAGGAGLSRRLAEQGEWWQMREYLVHRSVYHHKEADPHVWVVPRLHGRAKASLVAVEYDEFGGGREERVHARLYADLLAGAELDTGYLHYLDGVPAPAIAVVNMMSLFGLHRGLRGALVGHFAAAETTTAPSARRMVQALEQMGAHPDCVFFYSEHIEADAVHEQVMRRDVVGGLLESDPHLAADIVLGVQATGLLEDRLAQHIGSAWDEGRSSLRSPLPS
ncbi:iron-containing redox enzyme family protein [Streptomyces ovatisporus]|uniref:Iron-containing redox enzyme family protein n=1 Tax=Streptomyces ovatisporus TaxID=1128682 RepID=A0ABV9A9H8_9ACTN